MSVRLTLWDFIVKADKVHDFKYNYSKAIYVDNKTKLLITCTKCNEDFLQCPRDHLTGRGCRNCSYKAQRNPALTNDEFISKAEIIHKFKYNYSLVKYERGSSIVDIVCPKHGVFKQSALQHLTGRGCKKCSKFGFKSDIPGFFYILKFNNITKIGITNLTVAKRVKDISKSSNMNFEIVQFIKFEDGGIALRLETELLRYLRGAYKQPKEKYDGSTECFYDIKHEDLLLDISKTCLNIFSNK